MLSLHKKQHNRVGIPCRRKTQIDKGDAMYKEGWNSRCWRLFLRGTYFQPF